GWGCEGDLDVAMNERYQGFQAIVDTNGDRRLPMLDVLWFLIVKISLLTFAVYYTVLWSLGQYL
ncbi:hypothetical protein, partial [Microcoleus anatoxicus]